MKEEITSSNAIVVMLDSLGLGVSDLPVKLKAILRVPSQKYPDGSIIFEVTKRSSHQPYEFDFDSDIMKGFGIRYGNFSPRFQGFAFDEEEKELRILDGKSDFTLLEPHQLD